MKPKRYCLPAMTPEGLTKHFLKLGYRDDPLLESKKGADMTFVKPLPKGGQQHIRIWIGRKYFKIEEHNDRVDPNRDLFGHLIRDVVINGVPHDEYKISKRKAYYARAKQ